MELALIVVFIVHHKPLQVAMAKVMVADISWNLIVEFILSIFMLC